MSGQPEPPTLTISDITARSAKIKFESKYDKNLVGYNLRYRKNDNEDDEKKIDWNEANVDNNKDEYIMNNLDKKSNYQIFGRLKLLDKNIYSAYSKSKLFKTLNYVPPLFEWDPTKTEAIQFSNNNQKATNTDKYGNNQKFVSKTLLNGDDVSSVEWEITIRQKDERGPSYWAFAIGYMEEQAMSAINYNIWLGTAYAKNECSISMFAKERWKIWINNKERLDQFDATWKSDICKVGDRLKLVMYFTNKKCNVYYNDQLVGLLTNQLPHKIYPAAVMRHRTSIETTKWIVKGK